VPTFDVFLATYRFDPTALIVSLLGAALYLAGVVNLRRRGHRWPIGRTFAFLVFGVGLYAWVNFGFSAPIVTTSAGPSRPESPCCSLVCR